ncbi:MAG TPA: hypothetical protein VMD59_04245 [Acidimicrobiales bacterium]|nr:hypothetical protein [Acidimicrobiales bacterium]
MLRSGPRQVTRRWRACLDARPALDERAPDGRGAAPGRNLEYAFRRENRRDVGAKAPVVGGVASVAGSHASTSLSGVSPAIDNQATEAPPTSSRTALAGSCSTSGHR